MPWPVACKPSPGLVKKVTGVDVYGLSEVIGAGRLVGVRRDE